MSRIAVIPARGGSKRIERKNIKPFLGKPIIEYVIENALKSKLFDRVIVSTDDAEIASISKGSGAEVPYLRSKENSGDMATTSDVLFEVLSQLRQDGCVPELLCCIYPTSVLLDFQFVASGLDKMRIESIHTVLSIVDYGHPIWRAIRLTNEGSEAEMIWSEHRSSRSQDLEKTYHDAGQFYWIRVSSFLESRQILEPPFAGVVLPRDSAQDIDDESDWRMAQLKYRIKLEK